ncbi:Prolyl 4-hydroxylase [Seminavis robusta]|uniref:Prolyl 4-hydroxylase n=1 Tax=Seminavis robusta TaxID=568900 RepID=A0A9N8HDA6_9STRA|nr:Prolyl 4-hydroxylase [Seminavis robusta]|eukprot:Sro352_g124270.1 Prolyl 4-hydroxylase (449) ;mRNA; r:43642-45156
MMKLISWAVICAALLPSAGAGGPHNVMISNDSEEGIVVDWFNPSTGKPMVFSRLGQGESVRVNSFVNHTFLLRADGDNCTTEELCRYSTVVITDNDDQVIKVREGLEVEHRDSSTKAQYAAADIVQNCRDISKEQLAAGHSSDRVMKQMLSCVEGKTAETLEQLSERVSTETRLREHMSGNLENYTCADEKIETTVAEKFKDWEHQNVTRKIHLLHERKASKIHLVENFISPEECAAIEAAAKPILHRGTVADGKGGSRLSDHRKAMQAGIRIPFEEEGTGSQGEHIANLFRRIYAYTNNATGYGIEVDGQEDLMSIQYFGRGKDDKSPDNYRPHGDGDIDGRPHKRGGRVATMVCYCTADNLVGGGTNFGNANVFVKPKVGAAAFFSYLDSETRLHDTGFTSHSGCPVVEGVKRIAVHWMRIGVNKEMPWDSFNTLNIHKSECEEEE